MKRIKLDLLDHLPPVMELAIDLEVDSLAIEEVIGYMVDRLYNPHPDDEDDGGIMVISDIMLNIATVTEDEQLRVRLLSLTGRLTLEFTSMYDKLTKEQCPHSFKLVKVNKHSITVGYEVQSTE